MRLKSASSLSSSDIWIGLKCRLDPSLSATLIEYFSKLLPSSPAVIGALHYPWP